MRTRLTITLDDTTLSRTDDYIDGVTIRNRSHAIEYLLNKALYATSIQAVLLAGGEGERMLPFTYELPKAMLRIQQAPLIEHLIRRCVVSGIRDLIIVSEKVNIIQEHCGDGSKYGATIQYSTEPYPLGTGGALRHSLPLIRSTPVIVSHTDIFTSIDMRDLLAFHAKHGKKITMAVVGETQRQFGQVTMRGSLVTGLYEGSTIQDTTHLVNAGVYVLDAGVIEAISEGKSLFDDTLRAYIEKGDVAGYLFDGMWVDVGTPEEYEMAIRLAKERKSKQQIQRASRKRQEE